MDQPPLPKLAPRQADSHKGDFGQALLIGGSKGMAGAIALAGMAAVRSGAGLVRIAVPEACFNTVAGFSPCAMLIGLPDDGEGRINSRTSELEDWISRSSCVAIGPGLGRSASIDHFVQVTLQWMSEQMPECPLVIDADGLVALAAPADWLTSIRSPIVLTPHPGEWERLSGVPAADRQQQCAAAEQFAGKHNCTILLKGHRTLITDGHRSVHNQSGTPAMATGGSGDVLTGVITALICQGLPTYDAAQLGAHIHGRAGQLAAQRLGCHVVLPTELIEFLPAAFAEVIG